MYNGLAGMVWYAYHLVAVDRAVAVAMYTASPLEFCTRSPYRINSGSWASGSAR